MEDIDEDFIHWGEIGAVAWWLSIVFFDVAIWAKESHVVEGFSGPELFVALAYSDAELFLLSF